MKKNDFPDYLGLFFRKYLPLQRGLSNNTISSYSYSFMQFFRYCETVKGIKPHKLFFGIIDKALIVEFCNWLEQEHGNSIQTRNQRLTAIHAFFRYLQTESPEYVYLCRDVLSIKLKKTPSVPPKYISADAIRHILREPDSNTKEGLRELSMLALLYDSAARVQELLDLNVGNLRLGARATVTVTGKGNKSRTIPLLPETANILKQYIKAFKLTHPEQILFFNRSGSKMTRVGITYILEKYVKIVREKSPELISIKVTPHILRHSKSCHLLDAGVNLIYIRDLLGHSSVTTTEIYATANPDFLRKAIEHNTDFIPPANQFYNDDQKNDLLDFLKKLQK